MSGSVHDRLGRVRKPRVHIRYDVETEGAKVERELPFVVGVMGDFSGDPRKQLAPFGERKFIQIDRDNFDSVMKSIAPGLKMRVDNTLAEDGSEMAVDLAFTSMEDFEPARVAVQVPALKALLETRQKLSDMLAKADNSGGLEELLEQVLQDKGKLEQLSAQLGLGSGGKA